MDSEPDNPRPPPEDLLLRGHLYCLFAFGVCGDRVADRARGRLLVERDVVGTDGTERRGGAVPSSVRYGDELGLTDSEESCRA